MAAKKPAQSRKIRKARVTKDGGAETTNSTTKSTSKPVTLDDVIARELANDPAVIDGKIPEMLSADSPEGKALIVVSEGRTSLETIYGKPGIPKDDNVIEFPCPLPPALTGGKGTANSRTHSKEEILAALDKRLEEARAKEDREKMAMVTPKHPVTVVKNPVLNFPELYWKVYIQGPAWEEAMFADMFTRAKCSRADSIKEADLVVFTGGDDVNPALYGKSPHRTTSWDDDRDTQDIIAYWQCHQEGIPMLGVCRGAQFLHVMQGGTLYQHVDGHNGDHTLYDFRRKYLIPKISSVHHQMVVRNEAGGMEVLAVTTTKSKEKWVDADHYVVDKKGDVEVFFYRETMVLGVQGHPEYKNYGEFTKYVLDTMVECFATHPDIIFARNAEKGPMYMRIKPEILQERDLANLDGKRPVLAKMD